MSVTGQPLPPVVEEALHAIEASVASSLGAIKSGILAIAARKAIETALEAKTVVRQQIAAALRQIADTIERGG